jgi:hypothetical protein
VLWPESGENRLVGIVLPSVPVVGRFDFDPSQPDRFEIGGWIPDGTGAKLREYRGLDKGPGQGWDLRHWDSRGFYRKIQDSIPVGTNRGAYGFSIPARRE